MRPARPAIIRGLLPLMLPPPAAGTAGTGFRPGIICATRNGIDVRRQTGQGAVFGTAGQSIELAGFAADIAAGNGSDIARVAAVSARAGRA